MMRKLFLFMFMVNLGLLAYSQYQDTNRTDQRNNIADDIGTLQQVRQQVNGQNIGIAQPVVQLSETNVQAEENTATDLQMPLRDWKSTIGNCGMITDIKDRQQLINYAQQLNEIKITSYQTEKQTSQQLFRVVMGSMQTQNEARQKLTELKDAGFQDIWMISHGPLENAISLGVFSQQIKADNFANRLNTRGFQVETQLMNKIDAFYELIFHVPAEDEALQALVSQWKLESNITVYKTDCVE